MTIEQAGKKIREILNKKYTLYRRHAPRFGSSSVDEYEIFYGYDDDEMVHIVRDSWEEVIEALKDKINDD